MAFPETSKMQIFALIVHHLRTSNVNVYVSKIYPNGLIFGRDTYTKGTYIWDVNWVSYLGSVYSGGCWYTGGELMGFYGMIKHVNFPSSREETFLAEVDVKALHTNKYHEERANACQEYLDKWQHPSVLSLVIKPLM